MCTHASRAHICTPGAHIVSVHVCFGLNWEGEGGGSGVHLFVTCTCTPTRHVYASKGSLLSLTCAPACIFFFFKPAPSGLVYPSGRPLGPPKGICTPPTGVCIHMPLRGMCSRYEMHTPPGYAYACPFGACITLRLFLFDRTVDLRSPGF